MPKRTGGTRVPKERLGFLGAQGNATARQDQAGTREGSGGSTGGTEVHGRNDRDGSRRGPLGSEGRTPPAGGSVTVRRTPRGVRPGAGTNPTAGTCRGRTETQSFRRERRRVGAGRYRRVPMVDSGDWDRDERIRESGRAPQGHASSGRTFRRGVRPGEEPIRGPEELTGASREATRGLVLFPVSCPRVGAAELGETPKGFSRP